MNPPLWFFTTISSEDIFNYQQAPISHGTMEKNPQLPNFAQPSINVHVYNQSSHMPLQSLVVDNMRSYHASMSSLPLRGAQKLPNMAHIGTPTLHGMSHNVCMTLGSEHFMDRSFASLHTSMQDHTPQHMEVSSKIRIMEMSKPMEQAMNPIAVESTP